MSPGRNRRPHVVDKQTTAWEVVWAIGKFANFFSYWGCMEIREESSLGDVWVLGATSSLDV